MRLRESSGKKILTSYMVIFKTAATKHLNAAPPNRRATKWHKCRAVCVTRPCTQPRAISSSRTYCIQQKPCSHLGAAKLCSKYRIQCCSLLLTCDENNCILFPGSPSCILCDHWADAEFADELVIERPAQQQLHAQHTIHEPHCTCTNTTHRILHTFTAFYLLLPAACMAAQGTEAHLSSL